MNEENLDLTPSSACPNCDAIYIGACIVDDERFGLVLETCICGRKLNQGERVDTNAIAPALPTESGLAEDCWVVEDRGKQVLIGYGMDDRALVPRTSLFTPNGEAQDNERTSAMNDIYHPKR